VFLDDLLERKSEAATPLLIKIVVVLQVWLMLPAFTRQFVHSGTFDLVWNVGMLLVAVGVLVGIWRLRKWAVIALLILTALGLGIAALRVGGSGRIVAGAIAFRALLLVPCFVHWGKFS